MSERPDILDLVKQWVAKAEEDIVSAEYLMTMPTEAPYGTVCFHAQQCVEKYVKALLVSLSIDFPKVHDLGELLRLVPAEHRPELTAVDEERLTDFATTHRYPGDYEPPTRTGAEELVAIAQRVRKTVRTILPEDALSDSGTPSTSRWPTTE